MVNSSYDNTVAGGDNMGAIIKDELATTRNQEVEVHAIGLVHLKPLVRLPLHDEPPREPCGHADVQVLSMSDRTLRRRALLS
jgi:hypothetical protein